MKSSLLIAFLREKNGFRCGFESSQKCRCCVFNTPVLFLLFSFVTCFYLICVCCFFSVHQSSSLNPRRICNYFIISSPLVGDCRLAWQKKWNEKKCVNRNRFEICVKLLNTKVTEKSRSIFILYIVIIRKSVRLVLQEKKIARVAKKERKNTERRKPRHRRIS